MIGKAIVMTVGGDGHWSEDRAKAASWRGHPAFVCIPALTL